MSIEIRNLKKAQSLLEKKNKSVLMETGKTLGKVVISKLKIVKLKSNAEEEATAYALKHSQGERNANALRKALGAIESSDDMLEITNLSNKKVIAKLKKNLGSKESKVIEPTIDSVSDELKAQIIAEAIAQAEATE